jgi:hypothetical protein
MVQLMWRDPTYNGELEVRFHDNYAPTTRKKWRFNLLFWKQWGDALAGS